MITSIVVHSLMDDPVSGFPLCQNLFFNNLAALTLTYFNLSLSCSMGSVSVGVHHIFHKVNPFHPVHPNLYKVPMPLLHQVHLLIGLSCFCQKQLQVLYQPVVLHPECITEEVQFPLHHSLRDIGVCVHSFYDILFLILCRQSLYVQNPPLTFHFKSPETVGVIASLTYCNRSFNNKAYNKRVLSKLGHFMN